MVSPWTIFPALVVVSAVAVATFLLEFIKRTERKHSAESAAAASEFFQDPISSEQVACPSISDPAEKYMSLIIPAFNEEQRLPGALEDTMNYLQQRAAADKSFTYEVVIVDDGSTDGTSKVAFDFVRKHTIDNVRVILLGRNHGKGEAIRKQLIEAIQFCESIVKQGMLHSRGELLLMVDADGATKVSDLEKLEYQICTLAEKEFKSGGTTHGNLSLKITDIAVAAFGSRAHLEKQALATRKWYRNFLMKGFHLVVLLTAGPGIRDTQCGFKMFTRAAARKLFTNIRLKRWMDMLSHICRKGPSLNIPLSIPLTFWDFQTGLQDWTSTCHSQEWPGRS